MSARLTDDWIADELEALGPVGNDAATHLLAVRDMRKLLTEVRERRACMECGGKGFV